MFLNPFSTRPKTYNKSRYFNLKLNLYDSSTDEIKKFDINSDNPSPDLITTNRNRQTSTYHPSNIDRSYPSNYIMTTKYSLVTFLPKCLLVQFRKLANIYFLFTAILQCFPEISPLHPFSAVSPFIFVISLSLFREALEDYERFKSDKECNKSLCMVLTNGVPLSHFWSEIQVGNIVLIRDLEPFPADIILLASSLESGMCYIETSSLDGEKGLKAKQVIKETELVKNNQNLKDTLDWEFECPLPDSYFHRFEATLYNKKIKKRVMLNAKQFLPRGAKLKNTAWILGVVAYTGFDTKLMRNTENSKIKQSNIEKKTNNYIIGILIFQLTCCLISAIGYVTWNNLYIEDHFYLYSSSFLHTNFVDGLLTFFTYFILNNTMIPISLIVSLEFVKLAQSFFINKDEDMYVVHNDRNCKVMTSSINEELGQVQYIFSDKTGTLTCNKMQFKSIIIGDKIYGSEKKFFVKEDIKIPSKSNLPDHTLPELKKLSLEKSKFSNQYKPVSLTAKKKSIQKTGIIDERSNIIYEFNDSTLRNLIKATNSTNEINPKCDDIKFMDRSNQIVLYDIKDQKELVAEILQIMASCHECIIEKQLESNYIHYQGQSPDEIALVDAARHLGYKFLGISNNKIQIDILGNIKEVELLHLFEFNSDRKRMSILIKDQGLLKLYMKGADSKVKEKLDISINQPFLKSIEEKIDFLSKIGFRVLCFAMKIVTTEEYEGFNKKLEEIKTKANREQEILNLAEDLEKNCILIGATGVEDKLQENVPETIHDLLLAKIKFWMLTGDKLETAENIGKSCQLISPEMTIMRMSQLSELECVKKMDECIDIYKLCVGNGKRKAFLIEGEALNIVLSNRDLMEKFLHISKNCETVICCRVTPKQKADVVRLIKSNLNKVTLAVGDGANDVNMIQEAHIGIGIYGQEGLRAVQASDYAIGDFKSLWKLLLVHGRWSYIRVADMILYFFYKNMIMTFPQFIFSFYCCFSGQTLWDDYYITLYNMIFTCFPCTIRAILDQDIYYRKNVNINFSKIRALPFLGNDIRERNLIKKYFPKLYYVGQSNKMFNTKKFTKWIFTSFYQSLLFFYLTNFIFEHNILNESGFNSDFWTFSITNFTINIFAVNIQLGLYTNNWTLIFIISLFIFSLIIYIAYIWISDNIKQFIISYTANELFSSFFFYGSTILISVIVFLIEMTIILMIKEAFPSLVDYYRILIKTKQDEEESYFLKFDQEEKNQNNTYRKKSDKRNPSMFFRELDFKRKNDLKNKPNFQFFNSIKSPLDNLAKLYINGPQEENKSESERHSLQDEEVISEDVLIKQQPVSQELNKIVMC